MQCIICKKNNFEKAYSLKTKNILRCKNDGLFLADQTKKEKVYGKKYFSNSPNLNNQSYFLNKLKSMQLIAKFSKPSILNVGCGWGDFEEVMEKEKIPYLGIDVNKEAIEICKKKGLNCKLVILEQYSNIAIKQYDAITLFQVIEHLKNPFPTLKAAKKLLKPKGIILITTPNNDSPLRKLMDSRWSVYTEPSHYVFYSKKTLFQTLTAAGFKNVQVKLDQHRFLSSKYIFSRLQQMFFPNIEYQISNILFGFPIPTDPFGDLIATASFPT